MNTTSVSSKLDFSVFTCTYNRSNTLDRCYEGLCEQTSKNFEWIIFDNGSTDDTESKIEHYIANAPFPVVHLKWPENTGFQRTFNEGLKIAKGEFWTFLDSDDAFLPEALETMLSVWNSIPEADRDSFSGVTLNCIDQHGNLVGDKFPVSPLDSHYVEMMYRHKVKGEKWGMQKTSIIKEFPFPDSAHHISHGIVYRQIGKMYKTRYSNEAMRVYYLNEEGREDQWSQHLAVSDHGSVSRQWNARVALNEDLQYFWNAPFIFLKKGIVYNWFSAYLGVPFQDSLKSVKTGFGKLIVVVTAVPGRLLNQFIKSK